MNPIQIEDRIKSLLKFEAFQMFCLLSQCDKKNYIKLEEYFIYFINPKTKDKRKQKQGIRLAQKYILYHIYLHNPQFNIAKIWQIDTISSNFLPRLQILKRIYKDFNNIESVSKLSFLISFHEEIVK